MDPAYPSAWQTNYFLVTGYLVYLLISIGVTVWVARTLFKSGQVFLVDAFLGKEKLAESVNHLLVVGFYLVNVGYVALALKDASAPMTVQAVIELVCTKVGWVLVVLGAMHFFNLYVFTRLRRRAQLRTEPPPVTPREFLQPRAA